MTGPRFPDRDAQILALRAQGLDNHQIGEKVGLSHSRVSQIANGNKRAKRIEERLAAAAPVKPRQ